MTDITGAVVKIDDAPHLVLTRRFASSADEIWRELTESDRLERWIGRWEGDPATGRVDFFMTAEGDDVQAEQYTILECDRPRRFAGDTSQGAGAWHLWFELTEAEGTTTLRFGQRLNPTEDVGSIGPGWEYYLDRMTAAHEGRDVADIAWDDYFAALQADYERLVAAD